MNFYETSNRGKVFLDFPLKTGMQMLKIIQRLPCSIEGGYHHFEKHSVSRVQDCGGEESVQLRPSG